MAYIRPLKIGGVCVILGHQSYEAGSRSEQGRQGIWREEEVQYVKEDDERYGWKEEGVLGDEEVADSTKEDEKGEEQNRVGVDSDKSWVWKYSDGDEDEV